MASKIKLNEVVLTSPNGLVEKSISMGDDGIVKVNGVQSVTVEIGSNANGKYIKYSDGTLICTHALTDMAALSGNAETTIWVFPIPFHTIPAVQCTWVTSISDNPLYVYISDNPAGSHNTTQCKFRRHSLGTVPNYGNIQVMAIGRWKA